MIEHTFVKLGDIRMLINSKRIILVVSQDDDTFVVGWCIDKSDVMSFAKWSSGGLETVSILLA